MADAAAPGIDVQLNSEPRGTVATVTVDNRRKLNTLNSALMRDFIAQVEALARATTCARWCSPARATQPSSAAPASTRWRSMGRSGAEAFITLVHRTCDCLRQLPVPVIARIDGYALGAGLEVAVSCDLRVATSRAKFGMPEVKVGLPSVVEAALIPEADRLGPCPRTAADRRDDRRRDRAALGPGRARGRAAGAGPRGGQDRRCRCSRPARRRCAARSG